MKQLIFWGLLVLTSLLLFIFYDKVSIIKTVFDPEISSIWFDLALVLICGLVVVIRGYSIFTKLFSG